MTIEYQKFQYGSIERELDLSSVASKLQFIYVEDVLEAFDIPKANRFEVNGRTLPYMRDERGVMYQPKRISRRPGCVIQVICETTQQHPSTLSLTRTAESFSSTTTLSESVEQLTINSNKNRTTDINSEPKNTTPARRASTQLQSLKADAVAQVNHSGHRLSSEGMNDLIGKHLVPANNTESTLQYLTKNMGLLSKDVGLLVQDVGELKQQGNLLEQLARKMIEMQQQALDRLSLIQSKTEAILTQQLEIAEYPIPRLFIVLPEEPKEYDPGNWFRTKFRLHFICECGQHTETTNTKVRHHLHLAKHEGYIIREPTKIFKKYGPYLLLMLEMIKFGTSVAGLVVPALASLKVIELSDSVNQIVDDMTAKIDYSLECIDKQFAKVEASSPGDITSAGSQKGMTQQDLSNYLNNIEGLEGVELRQLESFLKISSKDNLLGNLYRMTTTEGHVKWVCLDHYRTGYQEKQVQKLREVVHLAKGGFDEQQGKITIELTSSIVAAEFYNALNKAKGVLELDVKLNWECTKADVEVLEKALWNTRVSILRLEFDHFRVSFGSRLRSITTFQFGVFFRLQRLPHMKEVHIILCPDLLPLFDHADKLQSRSQHCKLTIECSVQSAGEATVKSFAWAIQANSALSLLNLNACSVGDDQAWMLSDALKTNSTLTILHLENNSIGEKGAQSLAEALLINQTLADLKLDNNAIGVNGTLALSEALKVNSTLSTLRLENNSIGDKGVQALCDALKTNSTLIQLNLEQNSIGDKGAQAISEVLAPKSNLFNLNLANNSIGENGARALFEVLAANSSLDTLDLTNNSIGENGARALAKALTTNSRLAVLNLEKNSIGENGAQALSEALKVNSTLISLDLIENSILEAGAQAIFEALKINSGLRKLFLRDNSIGDLGAQELSMALAVNSTLIELGLDENSIGDEGVCALSEGLKINSTLTVLGLGSNSITDRGVQALSEALKTNSTLTSLYLNENSVGDPGAQALSEMLKANSALTILGLTQNRIGQDGAQALSKGLKMNSALVYLSLAENAIGDGELRTIINS